MSNPTFANVLQQSNSLPEYAVKTNQLLAANLEKVTAFQLATMQSYLTLSLERMRAAAEVNDAESLRSFVNSQLGTVKVLQEKLVADSKAAAALGNTLKADFEKLSKEGFAEVSKAAKPAPRKAAA